MKARNECRAVGTRLCGSKGRSNGHGWEGICGSRSSARTGVRHARFQPALGDCKNPGGFARGKGPVKPEYPAVAAVTLGTTDREGGTKAATVGRVCRGRNDVLAHGNAGVWNLIQSGWQA